MLQDEMTASLSIRIEVSLSWLSSLRYLSVAPKTTSLMQNVSLSASHADPTLTSTSWNRFSNIG